MSALEVQSVLQKMVQMRDLAGHWALGAGFEFQKLCTMLEKVHAKVLQAEPLVDSRSSAAYSVFIADVRRVALSVDDALHKFSSSTKFSFRVRRKLLHLVPNSILAPRASAQTRLQGPQNVNVFSQQRNIVNTDRRRQPSADPVTVLVLRPKIAKQFEDAHRDLQMLLRLFSTYVADLLPEHQLPPKIDPDVPSKGMFSLSEEPDLIGRNQDKKHVLSIINDRDTKVVAIVGMAGVGKTALTKHVYKTGRDKGFDYLMWVKVTQDFSPEVIFSEAMMSFRHENKLGEESESCWWSMKQGLDNKKYLLVLDSIWNEDQRKWNQLLHLLSTKEMNGSKIIVTTRIPAAAAAIPSVKTHNLLPLSVEDSLKLLPDNKNNSADVQRSIRKVAERCSGLPELVDFLKHVLGNTIANRADDLAERFDLMWKDDPKQRHMGMAETSYNYLLPHLRRCFLYCSLFPPNHIFDAEDMIYLWVAEGLSQVPIREEKVDDGFSKLLNECFVALDKSGSRGQMRYRMQYILHSFARNKGGDLYKAIKIEDSSSLSEHSIRYMSLMVDLTTKKLPILLTEQKDLRTLVLLRKPEMVLSCQRSEISEIPSDYCRYLTALRVLDLHATRIKKLPDTFHMLSNLRYLNLSETDIATLPESFDKLQYLIYLNIAQTCITVIPKSIDKSKSMRYLNLSQTGVRELPESIGNLRVLQTLKLSHCEKLVKLPQSIASLTSLQKLDLEGCHYLCEMPQDISKMKELKEMNILECSSLEKMPCGLSALTKIEALPRYIASSVENNPILGCFHLRKTPILELQGLVNIERLGLENIEKISTKDAENIKLGEKHKLQHLTLHCNMDAENSSITVEKVLDRLKPSTELKTLEITSYAGERFPCWMPINDPPLKKLTQMRLINLKCKSLPTLGQLPLLETLEIGGMNAIKHVSKELNGERSSENETFCSLKKLTFSLMLNLESWPAVDGATCPNLKELSIIQCPKFKKISMKIQIKKLAIWMSPHELLGSEGLAGVISAKQIKTMSVSPCEDLSSLSVREGLMSLSSLEELEISGCNELESLLLVWESSSN